MSSLRRRVFAHTGLLVGLQVLGTGLGFASWTQVRSAGEAQQVLAREQEAVLGLAVAAREVYVHQAHTLIERGPGHLDHLDEVTAAVSVQITKAESEGVAASVDLTPVRAAIEESNRWFAAEVVPLAQQGTLDTEAATRLHDEAELRASAVEARLGDVLGALDMAQARERAAVAAATSSAWLSVAALTVGGAALGLLVAWRLARGILGPVGELRTAAAAFGEGRSVTAPERGDDELSELGRAFNRMMEKVVASERRRLEVERLAALGEMSGAVAHELLNPLAVILGEPEMKRPELAGVRQEAEHARRVVQGLLGFARPGEEPAVNVDLVRSAEAAVDRIGTQADLRDVTVHLLPSTPRSILASPSAVRQVLDNLLRNAVEASSAGATVELELKQGPVFEVRDRGPGLPANVRPRLYEPFVTGRPDGTGLGLAVCQRIARAQGGSLAHRDREGGGTVAVWTLGGLDA
ncbi:MAG: HAMP domain-containing sensor histidine kinase [Myxococcota bacterium]